MSQRYHYIIRRTHSFMGIFPIGIFLMAHLFINSFAFRGPEAYNNVINLLHEIAILPYLELLVIGLPIAYHALYGIWIVYVTKSNMLQYRYYRNWMFYLQRVTAIITLFFVGWHAWVLRISRIFDGSEMSFSVVSGWLSDPVYFALYTVGYLAAIFHFSNGLWSFLVTWGITIGPESQKFSSYVCALVFAVISVIGISGLCVFTQF
ncbi:MAG TPA: succinate dehydrogenase cytochrome b558 subunit [Clostridia bacterium]|nr:succinate dehydrogenase cytochrome b558 subunit [Clostridia bacterium]